jgi:hypothetical protein
MDISAGISTATIAATAKSNGDAVTVSVMKKAMDTQESAAAQLIASVAEVSEALPDNLGNNLNVKA